MIYYAGIHMLGLISFENKEYIAIPNCMMLVIESDKDFQG